jgi:hypothetical protein
MTVCTIHKDFFDDMCAECKEEYAELKGLNKLYLDTYNKNKIQKNREKKYKEFSEERAKQLYGDLILQFLKSNYNEIEAAEKARSIIRKQCNLRNMPYWSWI